MFGGPEGRERTFCWEFLGYYSGLPPTCQKELSRAVRLCVSEVVPWWANFWHHLVPFEKGWPWFLLGLITVAALLRCLQKRAANRIRRATSGTQTGASTCSVGTQAGALVCIAVTQTPISSEVRSSQTERIVRLRGRKQITLRWRLRRRFLSRHQWWSRGSCRRPFLFLALCRWRCRRVLLPCLPHPVGRRVRGIQFRPRLWHLCPRRAQTLRRTSTVDHALGAGGEPLSLSDGFVYFEAIGSHPDPCGARWGQYSSRTDCLVPGWWLTIHRLYDA